MPRKSLAALSLPAPPVTPDQPQPYRPGVAPPLGPLSPEAARWRRSLILEYGIDDTAGLALVEVAAQAMDRMREARALIKQGGLIVLDGKGRPRRNPAVLIEHHARAAVLSALKQLNLDPGSEIK